MPKCDNVLNKRLGRAARTDSAACGDGNPVSDAFRPREPVLNAPWPTLLLSAGLVALFAWQSVQPDQDAVFLRYGLSAASLEEGRWGTLFSSMFVHGNWTHVILNAVAALAFGAPVARLFGLSPPKAVVFFAFFLICGAFSGWIFVISHEEVSLLVGASGGVSGLMGAGVRLLERRGRLAPLWSRTVLGMSAGWIIVNLLLGVTGLVPGTEGAPIAWEAHLAGYFLGLVLVSPFAALFARRGPDRDERAFVTEP